MENKELELKILGVINFTPNSFSENNLTLSEHKKNLFSKITYFKTFKNLIFDFGFESTAPFNQAISALEEKNRFEEFLNEINNLTEFFYESFVSFDTYKIENFEYFKNIFQNKFNPKNIIFNDVSGVLDSMILNYLKINPNITYVLNFTNIPNRNEVLNHQKYIQEDSIIEQCIMFFKKCLLNLKIHEVPNQVILDFGFGFSKTYEQNLELLENFEKIIEVIENEFGPKIWAIGISKKSFLRKKLNYETLTEESLMESEKLHKSFLKNIFLKKQTNLIIRAHDPKIVMSALL